MIILIIKEFNINYPLNYNYIAIETTGLSPTNDVIILIELCLCNKIYQLIGENLKDEEIILKKTCDILKSKDLLAYNGNFEGKFLREKLKLYGISYNIEIHSLVKKLRDYKFLFHLNKYSREFVEEYFNIERNTTILGNEVSISYQKYCKDMDISKLEEILKRNMENLKTLISLTNKIDLEIKNSLSIKISSYNFTIRKIDMIKNTILINGSGDFCENYFNSNKNYTVRLAKDFKVELYTLSDLYDKDNYCYYVMARDYKSVSNSNKIKSPDKILILYYKDFIIDNIINIFKYIVSKNLSL